MMDDLDFHPNAINLISCGSKWGPVPESKSGYVDATGSTYIFHIHLVNGALTQSLPNPFNVPQFKGKTGLDPDVQAWIFRCGTAQKLLKTWAGDMSITSQILHNQAAHGVQWYFQCVGGKHRSVAFVERLAAMYRQRGIKVHIIHRDILK